MTKKKFFPHVEAFLAKPKAEQDKIAKNLRETLVSMQAKLDPIVKDLTDDERVAIEDLVELELALKRGEDRVPTQEQLHPPERVRMLAPIFARLRELGAIFDEFREALNAHKEDGENTAEPGEGEDHG